MASLEHTTEQRQQSGFDPDQISDVPNHLHPIQSLILHSYVVRPAKFKYWNVMKQISLTRCFISESELDHIMGTCGALESLSLIDCDGFDKIVVRAPKLLELTIYSEDEISIVLETAPNITDLDLSLRCLMGPDGCDLFKLLMNIPRVELLNLVYHHCKDLPPLVKEKIQLPRCLPTDHLLRNLRALFLSFCLADADLIPILSCLFNSCPNLDKLLVVHDSNGVMSGTDGAYWERHQVADCMKHHLSFVDLQFVDLNSKCVVKFLKFLLMNACVLKIVTVSYCPDSVQPSLVELVENELRHLQWASSHAVLKFEPDFTA